MSLVTLDAVRMAYGGTDVLAGVTAELPHGARVGVVGANGAGKTTLLRLIARLEPPTAGRIVTARDARVVYVAQEPEVDPVASVWGDALQVFAPLRALERELAAAGRALAAAAPAEAEALRARYDRLHHEYEARGGYTYEADVRRVLTGLGLPERYWDRRAAGLSGGERARLALARALLQQPDVLLLDEPTNHLDLAAMEWLERLLTTRRGALIVVSHDRYFLDRVVDRIWELRDGRVAVYPGNYSHFIRLRAERDRRRQALYERQQEEIARTEDFIRRYGAGQRAREARGRETRLARLARIAPVRRGPTVRLTIDAGPRSGRVALRLGRVVVEHPGRRGEPLLTLPPVLELERGHRTALVGPNGSGKTTLLRTVAGECGPLSGRVELGEGTRVAFFRQGAEDLDADEDVLTSFLAPRNRPLPEARDLLARFLFRGEAVFRRVGDLSGGERARLALARIFACGANLLLLDEPTNHLDLPSREALEAVLPSFPGAILFVSHDRRFIDAVATHVWAVQDGALTAFAGNWSAYADRLERATTGGTAPTAAVMPVRPEPARDGRRPAPGRGGREEERRRAARLRDLERAVTDAEAALASLHAGLEAATAARDVERIAALGHALVEAEERLSALMAAWEQAASHA
jgi:ATP-binding cassette subfamily F protein 3